MSKLEKFKWNFRHYGGWKLLLAAAWLSLFTFVSYQIIGDQLLPDDANPWGIALVAGLGSVTSAVISQSFGHRRGPRTRMLLLGLFTFGLGGVASLYFSIFTYFVLLSIGMTGLFIILFGEKRRNSSP